MELTIAQKLEALLKLQQIDSQLDEIKKIRGDLPEEVRDLEDDIAGFETRINKFNNDIQSLEDEIDRNKTTKKDAEKLINKYKDQQMNVRNNREYDAISKEIELQTLEIELADKKINEATFKIRSKQEEIKATQGALDERKADLKAKMQELDQITAESEEDEKKLITERDQQATHIEERLLKSYNKIRNNALNGLAVVMVKRGACGGCFNVVPPQRQADIRDKKKIIVCEHCGRVFADVEGVPEPAPTGRR
ncbi:zinc ribbon domain-containing protein [Tellurirhabdus rosea]|uniref:zinc ribbon domain-containing protein n=1 Tax=Tellurirhabdus rosea TaxID=2674997 RepID=UPI0022506CCC|nr:C4-type zinc ribbon domain-containing protein [Tellurirhabdus rosea]